MTVAVPVVGGGPEGVGYQPIVGNPQSGAVLQVTPQLLPMHDTHAAVLDVCSVVTRSEGPAETLTFMSVRKPASRGTTVSRQRPASRWTA